MNKYSLPLLAVIFLTVGSYSSQSNSEDFYEVIDLGVFTDGDISNAYSISSTDQIVGFSNGEDFVAHAFVHEDGELKPLAFLDFLIEEDEDTGAQRDNGRSLAFAINDFGIAVGYSLETETTITNEGEENESISQRFLEVPVIFSIADLSVSKIASFESLFDDIDDAQNARALDVNNNGVIVGTGQFNEPEDVNAEGGSLAILFSRGFIYDSNTSILTKINPLEDELTHHLTLRAINDSNFAVGVSAQESGGIFFDKKVVGVDLNDPNNVIEFPIFSNSSQEVWAINSNNKFVGKAVDESNSYQTAFVYDIAISTATDLGVLNQNFPFSEAFDINDNDQIVGVSQTKSQPNIYSGFIYENGTMKDLDKIIGCDTGWRIHEARSINDNGVITGTGLLDGEVRSFMLKPLPGTAPVCEDTSLSTGSGSISLYGLFSMLFILTRRLKIEPTK